MELHLWRTNYVRTLKTNGGCYTSQSKQTGDAILLRTNKRRMLYFSEHTNGGCYASQNIQMGDALLRRAWVSAHNLSSTNVVPFVISITIYLRRISYQRFKLLKCWKLNLLFSFTIYNYTYVWLGNNKAYLWINGKSKFLHMINESLVFFISSTWAVKHNKTKHNYDSSIDYINLFV
jgi:hypothetical protein